MRLLRDEVLAEWQLDGPSPTLHVHCHVSGQERWLAPPHLRNYIFKREMALVRRTHWPAQSCPSHVRFVRIACLDTFCLTFCASLPIKSAHVSSCTRSCITSAVRNFIALDVASRRRRHLLQVLDTLAYAERELLEAMPAFKHASVLVHLQSDVEVRAH